MKGLTSRLLVFNLLLAVFPAGALFFLGTYEAQLLEGQERAMVQQGRLLASALEGRALAAEASAVLERLGTRNDSRLRVVDEGGRLLADSALESSGGKEAAFEETSAEPVQPVSPPEEHVIYRIGAWPARAIRRITRFIGRPRVSGGGDAE